MQQAQRTLISFIGLGSPQVASLLYSYVAEHPASCLPKKPTSFFSSAKRYREGIRWYEEQFTPNKKRFVCGELAADYLLTSSAAGLIARTYPSAKLFAVIDNPLLCVRVEYVGAIRSGQINQNSTLAQFIKNNPEVLLRAKFGRQLVQYFSYYSIQDLLVVCASEVKTEPLAVLKRTYEHIGLDAAFVPVSLKHLVVEEEDDSKKRPGLLKRMYKKLKQGFVAMSTKCTKILFPPKTPKETMLDLAKRVPLSPELEVYLKDYFHGDVAELSALLHRDFNAEWSI